MVWLLVGAFAFAGVGLWMLYRARAVREKTGLPAGRVVYSDTGAWERCDRPLFSSAYRLTGRPDYLIQTHSGVVPVEVKSGSAPERPYEGHILQLAAYCLLVEEMEGRAPPHGVLKYDDRAFEIDYTRGLRTRLLEVLGELQHALNLVDVSRDHDEPARCRACGYREQCTQMLE